MGRSKGALITCVVCTCGHLKILHSDGEISKAECHGECVVSKCPCSKFTWSQNNDTFHVKDTNEAWKYWGDKNFQVI